MIATLEGGKKSNMRSGDQIIPALNENVLGSVSTTLVAVYSFEAERQLIIFFIFLFRPLYYISS